MDAKIKILVVDDQQLERDRVAARLRELGHTVMEASDGPSALRMLEKVHSDVELVLTDLEMPQMTGVELTQRIKSVNPRLEVVVITGHGAIETAIAAIQAGASNYLVKPVKFEELELRVARIIEKRARPSGPGAHEDAPVLIAKSAEMKELLAKIDLAAATDSNILITGETGVGKEVIARHIHGMSPRAKAPFVAVNCSAIPDNLLESEFFGHEKGAFTGADQRSIGLFERASGGTMFLDELGEMDLRLQPKILRATEDRHIRRVGGSSDIKVDVRIVAATNKDLKRCVDEKKFREDLYFRLNVIEAKIPPLRDRVEDIPALTEELVRRLSLRMNVSIKRVDDVFINALKGYAFPGNVRELANIIERALIYATDGVLTQSHLPPEITGSVSREPKANVSAPVPAHSEGPLTDSVALYEKQLIEGKIAQHAGDLGKVAEDLKISRSTLYAKIAKHKIQH